MAMTLEREEADGRSLNEGVLGVCARGEIGSFFAR